MPVFVFLTQLLHGRTGWLAEPTLENAGQDRSSRAQGLMVQTPEMKVAQRGARALLQHVEFFTRVVDAEGIVGGTFVQMPRAARDRRAGAPNSRAPQPRTVLLRWPSYEIARNRRHCIRLPRVPESVQRHGSRPEERTAIERSPIAAPAPRPLKVVRFARRGHSDSAGASRRICRATVAELARRDETG